MRGTYPRLAANRANAQNSTGPRSAAGKQASSRNARKHGLSLPVHFEEELPPRYDVLARTLAAGRAEALPWARAAAEARFNIDRIRHGKAVILGSRAQALEATIRGCTPQQTAFVESAREVLTWFNYERRQRAAWRKAVKALQALE